MFILFSSHSHIRNTTQPRALNKAATSLSRCILRSRFFCQEECMQGKIDMIITKSISRFARNTLDCLKYIRQLKDKNIPVYFEKENINTMDSKGEILLTIMASLAQQESQSLSQNVKLGIQYRYQLQFLEVSFRSPAFYLFAGIKSIF